MSSTCGGGWVRYFSGLIRSHSRCMTTPHRPAGAGLTRERDTRRSSRRAGAARDLWDQVKMVEEGAPSFSLGQQQRLCIAGTIEVKPEVILMDEPVSALDPISTLRIEDSTRRRCENYTIVIVTHNCRS